MYFLLSTPQSLCSVQKYLSGDVYEIKIVRPHLLFLTVFMFHPVVVDKCRVPRIIREVGHIVVYPESINKRCFIIIKRVCTIQLLSRSRNKVLEESMPNAVVFLEEDCSRAV